MSDTAQHVLSLLGLNLHSETINPGPEAQVPDTMSPTDAPKLAN